MKKLVGFLVGFIVMVVLITPAVAQLAVSFGAGVSQNVPAGKHGKWVFLPLSALAVHYQVRDIVITAEARPTVSRLVNSPNNLGARIGYRVGNFIPAIGYYFNLCNADNPEFNTAGFGAALKYDLRISENGSLFFEGAYINDALQILSGIQFNF